MRYYLVNDTNITNAKYRIGFLYISRCILKFQLIASQNHFLEVSLVADYF